MKRTALTNESGKWFDMDVATKFDENTRWNGNNNISMATGSQWNHEGLYRSKSGRWILNEWSQMQGSTESYAELSDSEAAEWFMKNEYNDEHIPGNLLDLLKKHIDELEI